MSTWMVVEDEPTLYDTLLALFGIWSIDGVAFTNGTDAMTWIDAVDRGSAETNIPELAILDIRLPEPDIEGHDIGARLRQSPVLKDITIVLITVYHLSVKDEKRVIETADADALIYKPLPSPSQFKQQLQEAIVRRQALTLARTVKADTPKLKKKASRPKPNDAIE